MEAQEEVEVGRIVEVGALVSSEYQISFLKSKS